jgi:Monooxygenase af470-like
MTVDRRTVDLSAYPDLVVIYLGMRVNAITGIKTVMGFGPRISNAAGQEPEGLLLHEQLIYSIFPPHVGMRQYWRDFESLERWSRSEPHMLWWKEFLRNSAGTGFWHETYFMRGGMEAIYDDIPVRIGFSAFAPVQPARGPMCSARTRLKTGGTETKPTAITEAELYPGQ